MVFVPRDYISVFDVARRAAAAAPAGTVPRSLDKATAAFIEARYGPAWEALLGELQTDKAHAPHTVSAYAWGAGRGAVEIPVAYWQRGPEREWKPRNHASLHGLGFRMWDLRDGEMHFAGPEAADEGDTLDMHVMFDGAWVLPVMTKADAEAFIARYTGADAAEGSPAIQAVASTIAAEKQLRLYLESRMRAAPSTPPGKKKVKAEAAVAGHKVSDRAFERAWAAAVKATDAKDWSAAGRKSPRRIETPI